MVNNRLQQVWNVTTLLRAEWTRWLAGFSNADINLTTLRLRISQRISWSTTAEWCNHKLEKQFPARIKKKKKKTSSMWLLCMKQSHWNYTEDATESTLPAVHLTDDIFSIQIASLALIYVSAAGKTLAKANDLMWRRGSVEAKVKVGFCGDNFFFF